MTIEELFDSLPATIDTNYQLMVSKTLTGYNCCYMDEHEAIYTTGEDTLIETLEEMFNLLQSEGIIEN
jgi:hypothetical protein